MMISNWKNNNFGLSVSMDYVSEIKMFSHDNGHRPAVT